MSRLSNDPRVAKTLANPAGRIGFAAVAGLVLFQTMTGFRAVVDMMLAWQEHVVDRGGRELPTDDEPAAITRWMPDGYIECRACFATIDQRATICPACRTEAPTPADPLLDEEVADDGEAQTLVP